jgi:hypothetical protein
MKSPKSVKRIYAERYSARTTAPHFAFFQNRIPKVTRGVSRKRNVRVTIIIVDSNVIAG